MQKLRFVLKLLLLVSIVDLSQEAMAQSQSRRTTGLNGSRRASRLSTPGQFSYPLPNLSFYSSAANGASTGIHSQRLTPRTRQNANQKRPSSIYDLRRPTTQSPTRRLYGPRVAGRSVRPAISKSSLFPKERTSATSLKNNSTKPRVTRKRRAANNHRFQQVFWHYLTQSKNPYKKWAAFTDDADKTDSQNPHGSSGRLYANHIAATNSTDLPYGSILVREHLSRDKKTLQAISVMYRARSYNPQNHDWYWVKYLPDGTVAKETSKEQSGQLLAGQSVSCINCHRHGGKKLVFSSFTRDLALNNSPNTPSKK